METTVQLKELFREFVLLNPEDELVMKVLNIGMQKLLNKTTYTDVASHYLEGYQKYPKGKKALINLLKLRVSMVQIGEKDQRL